LRLNAEWPQGSRWQHRWAPFQASRRDSEANLLRATTYENDSSSIVIGVFFPRYGATLIENGVYLRPWVNHHFVNVVKKGKL
jgi:hypothetical protein